MVSKWGRNQDPKNHDKKHNGRGSQFHDVDPFQREIRARMIFF